MVMVPESGRVSKTAVLTTLRMIQTFTLSYPASNRQQAPKLFVVFTNFSKFEKESSEEESGSECSEAEEEPTETPSEEPTTLCLLADKA